MTDSAPSGEPQPARPSSAVDAAVLGAAAQILRRPYPAIADRLEALAAILPKEQAVLDAADAIFEWKDDGTWTWSWRALSNLAAAVRDLRETR